MSARLFVFAMLFSITVKAQNRKLYLNIGDKCPDLVFKNLINTEAEELKLSDFENKAIILDFWAPWCVPCLENLPKLDSLQVKYQNSLKVMPITKESKDYAAKILSNLEARGKIGKIISATEDTLVSKFFNYKVIPHYVWIGKNRIIQAITSGDAINETNIKKLIAGDSLNLPTKTDSKKFDDTKPYFASGQVDIKNQILYQSTLTGFIQNPPNGSIRGRNWISCSNHSILHLYKIAFGEFNLDFLNNNRIILKGFSSLDDSIKLGRLYSNPEWKQSYRDYSYCYELVAPDSLYTTKQLFGLMQRDLNKYFEVLGISGKMEKKKIKVLSLVRIGTQDKLMTKGGRQFERHGEGFIQLTNMPIGWLIMSLQGYFNSDNLLPIINETNYMKNIDIEINADVNDLEKFNRELKRYGLSLIKTEKVMDMIVITKTKGSNS